jgi:hypothetical protein
MKEGKKFDFYCLKITVNNFLKKGSSHKIGKKKTQSGAAFFFCGDQKIIFCKTFPFFEKKSPKLGFVFLKITTFLHIFQASSQDIKGF